MPKYDNQNIKGLQDLGFYKVKPCAQDVCALCEKPLRETVLSAFICDHCGAVFVEEMGGLLVKIGRRKRDAKMQEVQRLP